MIIQFKQRSREKLRRTRKFSNRLCVHSGRIAQKINDNDGHQVVFEQLRSLEKSVTLLTMLTRFSSKNISQQLALQRRRLMNLKGKRIMKILHNHGYIMEFHTLLITNYVRTSRKEILRSESTNDLRRMQWIKTSYFGKQ